MYPQVVTGLYPQCPYRSTTRGRQQTLVALVQRGSCGPLCIPPGSLRGVEEQPPCIVTAPGHPHPDVRSPGAPPHRLLPLLSSLSVQGVRDRGGRPFSGAGLSWLLGRAAWPPWLGDLGCRLHGARSEMRRGGVVRACAQRNVHQASGFGTGARLGHRGGCRTLAATGEVR